VTHSLASSIGRNGEGLEANRGEEEAAICHLPFVVCRSLFSPFTPHSALPIPHFFAVAFGSRLNEAGFLW
jgi:hypothetical protein